MAVGLKKVERVCSVVIRVWPESLCLPHGSVWMPSGDGRRRGGKTRPVACSSGGARQTDVTVVADSLYLFWKRVCMCLLHICHEKSRSQMDPLGSCLMYIQGWVDWREAPQRGAHTQKRRIPTDRTIQTRYSRHGSNLWISQTSLNDRKNARQRPTQGGEKR